MATGAYFLMHALAAATEGAASAYYHANAERLNWRMPPLALLKPVDWSTGTKLGLLVAARLPHRVRALLS